VDVFTEYTKLTVFPYFFGCTPPTNVDVILFPFDSAGGKILEENLDKFLENGIMRIYKMKEGWQLAPPYPLIKHIMAKDLLISSEVCEKKK